MRCPAPDAAAADARHADVRIGLTGLPIMENDEMRVSEHNLPVIANSIARIECTIHSITEAGDHWFVLGNVLHMETTRDEDPMLFHRGRYGGFSEMG